MKDDAHAMTMLPSRGDDVVSPSVTMGQRVCWVR